MGDPCWAFKTDEWMHNHLPWRVHAFFFKWFCNWVDRQMGAPVKAGQVPNWPDALRRQR